MPPQELERKWALEDEEEAPPNPAKVGGAARGRGQDETNKNGAGHLWAWQRVGHYDERPPYHPARPTEGKGVASASDLS